ncbi:hypothetical protein Y032_0002g780 [Ancylostoma ceylanicum]|uniref:Uncharacterized protein n=1 Tax=Ancylostoma ceylanicum TaxID=53326 RepID=A0A016W330_9BILA|nr:hypothetical protein Y032_0002g780 [Ancylostoma ceylanicum]
MFGVVVVLSIPVVLLACSALPPGQEVRITFQVDGLLTIPVEFAYSIDQTNVLSKFPKFSKTSAEAVTNVQKYVKRALTLAIKEEARRAGIESQTSNIASQIKPTVYYNPLNCSAAADKPTQPTQGVPGNSCVVKTDIITNVAYDATTPMEIPVQFQQFVVGLSVSNYIIGGWSRDMWELTLIKVQKQLKSGTYGTSFRTASLSLV